MNMTVQEVEMDVDKVLNTLPRFKNDFNRAMLLREVYAQGQTAVVVFENIQGQLKTNEALAHQALQAFHKAHPGSKGVEANEKLLKEVAAAVTNPTVENFLQAFERIRGQLATNSEYTEAFVDFFRAHPEWAYPGQQGGHANVDVLTAALKSQDVTLENLELLLELTCPPFLVQS